MGGELILGIDPGTAVTGYGVVAKERGGAVSLVECGVVRTSPREALPFRIREIYEVVSALIARHQPSGVVVEDVVGGKNVQSALKRFRLPSTPPERSRRRWWETETRPRIR